MTYIWIMVRNQKEELIIKLIEKSSEKCVVGMELSEQLEKRLGIKSDAARKSLQRAVAKGLINSTKPLTFGKGQFGYYLTGQVFNHRKFFNLTKKWRPPLYRIMSQIKENAGIISYYEAMKIGATLVKRGNSKGNDLNNLITELEAIDFIKRVKDQHGIEYLIDKETRRDKEQLIAGKYAHMKIDTAFLYDIINFLKRQNIIDNQNVTYRNRKNPGFGIIHNNLAWDAIAYTKTTGINTVLASNSKKKDKSALVVLEVVIHRPFNEIDLQGLYDRIQIVRNSVKATERKVLPIVIFKEISEHIFNRAQTMGFLTLNLGAIFGERIFKIIQDVDLLHTSNLDPDFSPEDSINHIDQIIHQIMVAGQGINLSNIIGDLFESLILHLLRKVYPNVTIQQNKTLYDQHFKENQRYYEYDFIIEDEDEIVVVECKGYPSKNTIKLGDWESKNTLKWFFNNTLQAAQRHFKEKSPEKLVRAVFITSAKLEADAIPYLEHLNMGNLKPHRMEIAYDGDQLLDFAKQYKLKDLIKTLEKYYF